MFSAWDFNSWIISVGVVLFMLSFLTGFGALVTALLSRIWGEEERDVAATPYLSSTAKKPPIRKAA